MVEDMHVLVETKPGCPRCQITKSVLSQKGIEFKTKLVHPEVDHDEINKLIAEGHQSFPVVYVYDNDGNLKDSWDSFRVDKINQLFLASMKDETVAL